MTAAVLLGVALAAGTPWPVVAAVGLAVWQPFVFLAAVGAWVVWTRRRRPRPADAEAPFLRALAAEMRGGATLHGALVAAAGRTPQLNADRLVRVARLGRPAAELAEALEDALEENGVLAGAAVDIVADCGAPGAATFTALAVHAEEGADLRREGRALSSQARLSAWVVGLAPVGVWMLLAASGRAGALFRFGGAGYAVLAVGAALEAAGALAVWRLVRRPV